MSREKCMYESRVTEVIQPLPQKKFSASLLVSGFFLEFSSPGQRLCLTATRPDRGSAPRFPSLTWVGATIMSSCEVTQERSYGSIRRRRHHLVSTHPRGKISRQPLLIKRRQAARHGASRSRHAHHH